jgi:hypothetical protein
MKAAQMELCSILETLRAPSMGGFPSCCICLGTRFRVENSLSRDGKNSCLVITVVLAK